MTFTMKAFKDSAEHLRAEMELLEERLRYEVAKARNARPASRKFDEFSGLYVSDEEIDQLADEEGSEASTESMESESDWEARLSRREAEIRERAELAAKSGIGLRLPALVAAYGLEESERRILLACLAPDLDLRFERYFAYLQNDISRKRPCIQLLARLFLSGTGDYRRARRLFGPLGKLIAGGILLTVPSRQGNRDETSFPSREPQVLSGVADFLMDLDHPDPVLSGVADFLDGRELESETAYFRFHAKVIRELAICFRLLGALPSAYLGGSPGSGRTRIALGLAHALGRKILNVDLAGLMAKPGEPTEILAALAREARLHGAMLFAGPCSELSCSAESGQAKAKAIVRFLKSAAGLPLILWGEKSAEEMRILAELQTLRFEIPAPNLEERHALWEWHLRGRADAASDLAEGLAAKFKFTPGQVRAAVGTMRLDSEPEGRPADQELSRALYLSCRSICNQNLLGFAQRIAAKYDWNDLVLPQDTWNQLREIRNCVRHRRQVYHKWGFEGKFSLGKGLNILFSGASGTGKTMSAEVLAKDLGVELYKIDLSSVVSKYIGETEKNLARIFREAETSHCILFFDEADALFGKRSEVKDSHDRYANIEVNFLLQRMEEYEGMVILATNLMKNLDQAFTRRIHYIVEFPMPDEKFREKMWTKVFPAGAPLSEGLDLDFLAKKFNLSGASIKNIALNSAFLAAEGGGNVDMGHLILALKREYQKMGKLCSRSDFGPYYNLVREEAAA